jgi:hypothetical protein
MSEYSRMAIEELDFDGLRFDFVKGYGAWMICWRSINTRREMVVTSLLLWWESTGLGLRISAVGWMVC